MTKAAKTGGCLCGAVRYRVAGPLRDVVNCHCGQCRRVSGHFAAFTASARAALTFTEDRGLAWYRSSDTVRRGFCRHCGATLFWDARGRDYIAIAAGGLDAPSGLRTVADIFTADAGDYYDLPEHDARWPGPMDKA